MHVLYFLMLVDAGACQPLAYLLPAQARGHDAQPIFVQQLGHHLPLEWKQRSHHSLSVLLFKHGSLADAAVRE